MEDRSVRNFYKEVNGRWKIKVLVTSKGDVQEVKLMEISTEGVLKLLALNLPRFLNLNFSFRLSNEVKSEFFPKAGNFSIMVLTHPRVRYICRLFLNFNT